MADVNGKAAAEEDVSSILDWFVISMPFWKFYEAFIMQLSFSFLSRRKILQRKVTICLLTYFANTEIVSLANIITAFKKHSLSMYVGHLDVF